MLNLKVPIISVLLSNGASGGALALAVSDYLIAIEDSYLSIISPYACLEIINKEFSDLNDVKGFLKCDCNELYKLGIVDHIIRKKSGTFNESDVVLNLKRIIYNKIIKNQKICFKKRIKLRKKKYDNY